MAQLLPCPSCSRHVRRTENGCPFCGAALELAELPLKAMPTQRLGRAATFAFGAAVATSVAACSGGPAPAYGAPAVDTGIVADGGSDGGAVPLYGGPPQDAGNDAGMLAMYGGPPNDAGSDAGGPAPAYGGPIFDDSGISDVDSGGASADYGAPPAPAT
jgi:hypothetical protein